MEGQRGNALMADFEEHTIAEIRHLYELGVIDLSAVRRWLVGRADRVKYDFAPFINAMNQITEELCAIPAPPPLPVYYDPCEICGPGMNEDGKQVRTRSLVVPFMGESVLCCDECYKQLWGWTITPFDKADERTRIDRVHDFCVAHAGRLVGFGVLVAGGVFALVQFARGLK